MPGIAALNQRALQPKESSSISCNFVRLRHAALRVFWHALRFEQLHLLTQETQWHTVTYCAKVGLHCPCQPPKTWSNTIFAFRPLSPAQRAPVPSATSASASGQAGGPEGPVYLSQLSLQSARSTQVHIVIAKVACKVAALWCIGRSWLISNIDSNQPTLKHQSTIEHALGSEVSTGSSPFKTLHSKYLEFKSRFCGRG